MKLRAYILGLLLIGSAFVFAQRQVPQGIRQADATEEQTQKNIPPPPQPIVRVDRDKMGREADELSRLAQTIPTDVAGMNKGLLSKDAGEKLKRIEKLAKQLRGEINR